MARISLAAALAVAAAVAAPDASDGPDGFAQRPQEYRELVDEDEQYAPREQAYAFNPVQARNELKVGLYYSKKGSHRAAAGRYLEATRWDPNLAEAYWRLGMARERLAQALPAIEAYARYLQIEPSGKKAREIGKRLAKLRDGAAQLPVPAREAGPGQLP